MSHENAINQINVQQRWLDMVKTIDFKYMTKNLKKLFEEITKKNNQFIVKSNGQNVAVLIPFDEYQRLTELAEEKEQAKENFFDMVDELREYNKDVPYEQIEKDVAQAVAEVRQMKYGKPKTDD